MGREKMQKPPQIIVIPQSMLAGQKSLLRLAPSPMNRNSSALLSTSSPSPLLSSAAISPMLSSNPRPVAAVVGSKRPAPTVSPQPKELLLDIKEENTENEAPARKRANLDHLSPEERMMRRKLKNRVAAQTARDKKKAATDSMEKQLADVQARLQESLDANAQLLKTNTQLQMENASLQQQNSELQARLSPLCTPPPSPPASPLPSPSATSPHTPLSTVLSPPETADLTCVPQQQEQGKSTMPRASSNPGLSSKDLTPWGRAPALTVVCAALLALSPKQQPPTNPSPSPSPSAASLEEETYPLVGLSLNTDIGFDLGDTLNTPTTTTTTGNILDGFLADTEMMAMADSEKWEKSLDDLFPDLD